MTKTKYRGVFSDGNKYFYVADLGVDAETGKRIQKKSRKSKDGKPFTSALAAHKELTALKNAYYEQNGYANYRISYATFMKQTYLPAYKASVEDSTYQVRNTVYQKLITRFGKLKLRSITILDCERLRNYLLNDSGLSQGYCHLVYGAFRQSLEYAVKVGFLDSNISKRTKSIPKGKSIVPFWTKAQFERVISTICINDFYEHKCFVMLWLYFMTGIRVGEGQALTWNDIDLKNQKIRVYHTMVFKNKTQYTIKAYTKTVNGMRIVSLDGDTCRLLKDWKKIQRKHGVTHFVISHDDMPTGRSSISRIIKRYAKLAGLPAIQAKGLRHSHVSYLINEFNADVLTVSRRLGHSSPEITLKYYAHLWSRNDESLAEQMAGNLQIEFAKKSLVKFNGNQAVRL